VEWKGNRGIRREERTDQGEGVGKEMGNELREGSKQVQGRKEGKWEG